ncbi:MAG: hypothetical protein ISQ76_02910 [Opitutales bacterium]|nr:hypothetical protein [Opitutales bacterium]
MRYKIINFFIFSFCCHLVTGQTGELRSVEEVIRGIDELLGEYDQGFEAMETAPVNPPVAPQESFPSPVQPRQTTPENYFDPVGFPQPDPLPSMEGSYRLDNELLPEILRKPTIEATPVEEVVTQQETISLPEENPVGEAVDAIPSVEETVDTKISLLPNIDYKNANLEDLLREVDSLELPEFESPIVLPPSSLSQDQKVKPLPSVGPTEDKLVRSSKLNKGAPEIGQPIQGDNYIVLGERIDQELREKIREAIMSTRLASGGTGNPFVTRSVFKAESNCNKVLGRLNAPFHKRYRRDILLSLIRMHERNKQWVNAAKTYERYLDEFAADDSYPFEDHEDAPGIPDLQAGLNSVTKWLEGIKRGAPTIPETHVRLGKIYRHLGAHRMALNKFYDAIRGTLTIGKNEAFELADRRNGRNDISRSDAESNQAMFEIAETFMDSEDYDQAVKFYDRLWRLDQLRDFDRAIVRFKQGVAHYRRALDNLRKLDRNKDLAPELRQEVELPFDKTPRADFAKVKEVLRGYGTIYPESPYVPESHYILALTFEQLNQDEESIRELLVLLKEADFHPDKIAALQVNRTTRDQDLVYLNKMRRIWNFWKKKTGNYLANQFFENAEYFNAYRIYSALRKIDSSPTWQVPLLYQIALCEEKLGNYVQATETYISIENFVNSVKEAREDLASSEYLNFVFGMAKWRREQLEETRAIRQAVNRYGIFSTSADAGSEFNTVPN